VSSDEYAASVSLKIYRGETGPVGRLRVLNILKNRFNASDGSISAYAKGRWGIPDEFLINEGLRGIVLSLNDELLNYLDSRDIGFKTIRILAGMSSESAALLGLWAAACSRRVNIFKSSVEMAYEIIRRDGPAAVDSLARGVPLAAADIEGYIFNTLLKLRYPEHQALSERAGGIVKRIASRGISADFPLKTENDFIALTVRLGRKRGLASAISSLEDAADDINSLLDLL
jgi:hypothetical protein